MKSKSFTCVLLLACAFLAGCDRLTSRSDGDYVQRANVLRAEGKSTAAIIELKNALQQNPRNAEARLMLAELYLTKGFGKDAESEILRARDLGVSKEATRVPLGKALLLQREYKRVLSEIGADGNANDESRAALLAMRGEAQLALGDKNAAKESFKQALALDPASIEANIGQARWLASERDFDAASNALDGVLSRAPNELQALLLQGELLQIVKEDAKASEAYRKILALHPENGPAAINLASILIAGKEYQEAAKVIATLHDSSPKHPAPHYMRALLEFSQGKHKAALDAVQESLAMAPDHPQSLLLAATARYELGAYEQAERELRAYLAQDRSNLFVHKLLAATLLKMGRAQEAVEVLTPVLASFTGEDAQLFALAGDALIQTKNYVKGSEYLQRAAASDPNNPQLRTALAASRFAMGDTKSAVQVLESAVQLEGEAGRSQALLIMAQLNSKDYGNALKNANEYAKRQPDNPVAFNLLGAAYQAKDDTANARKYFEKALALRADFFPAAANLAQLDLQAKNAPAARRRFEHVLATDPNNLQAMMALAQIEGSAGNGAGLVAWLEKARKAQPTAVLPRLELYAYYFKAREFRQALQLAQEAQAIRPNLPEVIEAVGQSQLASGQPAAAANTFTQLVKISPRSAVAHFRLGSALMAEGNTEGAISSLQKAILLQPNFLEAKAALAGLYVQRQRYDEALKLAQDIQKAYPNSSIGFALQGDLLYRTKKYPQALKAYETASRFGPSLQIAIGLDLSAAQGDAQKNSHAKLKQWLRDNPVDDVGRLYFADGLLAQGKIQEAKEQYELLVARRPDTPLVLNNLAGILHRQKDPRALSYAERAFKLAPDHPSIGDTLGWILLEQGATERAVKLLATASGKAPQRAEIKYHYAAALVKAGDAVQARKLLEDVLATDHPFEGREKAKEMLKQL